MNSSYAELRCKTNFSFLEGASHADELAKRAAELGYAALAITDRNSLAGIVRAHAAAKSANLKLLIGAEITPENAPPVLLYAPDLSAYQRLSRLITHGRRSAEKGSCSLYFNDIAEHAEGLLAVILSDDAQSVQRYRSLFRGRCWLAAALHHDANDEQKLERLLALAQETRMPLIATNDVHYHEPNRRPLQDVLTAIRHGLSVADLGNLRFPNGERYLKSPADMATLFSRYPRAIQHALELAERCTFSLDELRYEYPEELCPPDVTPFAHLTSLTWVGANERYPQGVPEKVRTLLERELTLIEELRYEAFFLTVWNLVRFARERGILCQGRGSAANSAVCYCLNITSVDPGRTDVLFERFVSRERNEPPDIDVDFEHERREEVIQYIYETYGRDRAGIAAEVITYRPRSAVRDVGKALGFSLDRVDALAKALEYYGDEANLSTRVREAGLDPRAPGVNRLIDLAVQILGFPRHLSQHVGGFVMTQGPLSELVPIENAAMPDRTFIEWDKDDLDTMGMLKVDCLSLGMLTAIRKCMDFVRQTTGRHLTLATIPAEDPAVYDMICRADTVGVFQVESRAQMSMSPRLQPKCFYDLVVQIAIVRPGPIQGGMVHPYLRRRSGQEKVTYPAPIVEEVLGKTLGVPLFQEQVMRLAMVAAGFTPGEADQLRRAMGAWRKSGVIEQFRVKLRDGMLARGLPLDFAEQIFEQVRGFGEYGFPEAHASSFALLAYVSAWLKLYYPAAFAAALVNSQPMGFYAPAQIIRDAQEHGVEVRPIDVNFSDWDCTLEPLPPLPASGRGAGGEGPVGGEASIRLGYRLIKGMPHVAAQAIVEARAAGPFRSIADFTRRTGASRAFMARLAAADAFGSLALSRRLALWHALAVAQDPPLFADVTEDDGPPPSLEEMPLIHEVRADYQNIGMSLKAHPISFLRHTLKDWGAVTAAELARVNDQSHAQVAGLVLVRQRPSTSKGTIFITLEDETGTINLVIWPHVWERYRRSAGRAVALSAHGKIERVSGVIHVLVTKMEDLSQRLRGLESRSRNFR